MEVFPVATTQHINARFIPVRAVKHPSEDLIDDYALIRLPLSEVSGMEAHLDRCLVCRSKYQAALELVQYLREADALGAFEQFD